MYEGEGVWIAGGAKSNQAIDSFTIDLTSDSDGDSGSDTETASEGEDTDWYCEVNCNTVIAWNEIKLKIKLWEKKFKKWE